MEINDNVINIPDDPNTMNFFHGGDLDEIKDNPKYKSDRQHFGSGLYLTTSYDVAKKYAKGNRKFYLVTVENGNEIHDVKLNINVLIEFINQNFSKNVAKKILELANYKIYNNEVPAYLINNILINHKFLRPKNTPMWRNFLVSNGIDYEIVDNAFGFNETMMILFNTRKIKYVKRILPTDRLPYYNLKTKS